MSSMFLDGKLVVFDIGDVILVGKAFNPIKSIHRMPPLHQPFNFVLLLLPPFACAISSSTTPPPLSLSGWDSVWTLYCQFMIESHLTLAHIYAFSLFAQYHQLSIMVSSSSSFLCNGLIVDDGTLPTIHFLWHSNHSLTFWNSLASKHFFTTKLCGYYYTES